jgi:outer membrane protein TolC
MRNFKLDNTRATLRTTQIQQEQAEIDLRATIASTDAQTRNAYWELVYAVQAVEAAQRSLDLSTKLVQDNRSRVEIGTMAPIDIVQAQAEEATRRQQLVNAQATLRNNELALKRLIVSGTEDELWRATLNPVDRPAPPSVAEPLDVERALGNALQNRTDLLNTRKTIESSNVTIESFKNQIRPQLDMVTTYTLRGAGGTAYTYDRTTGAVTSTTPGGYFNAIRNIYGFDLPTWNVQFNFAMPIGNSAPQANLARQRILLEQNQATIKTTELQIATDVTSAALAVRNTLESVQAAATSRELSEKRLEAIQSKFEVGMSTNYEIVQAQRDLADARNSELRAMLNYRKALVDFQRVQISPR